MAVRRKTPSEIALITGASSGIGEALAHRFAAGGCDLVLVARSAGRLEALAARLAADHGIRAWVEAADLSRPTAAAELATTLKRKKRQIDVLVNNAGIAEQGSFVSMSARRGQALIDLNVTAVTAMLSRFLPPMIRRGHGRVLNVASISSFFPVPTMAIYAATKAYVLSLTESLAEELEGTGVSITALCPGVTDTRMVARIHAANEKTRHLSGVAVANVDAVANEGYEACMQGEVIRVPGTANLLAALSGRALPKWMVRRIAGTLGRRTM
jgi:short-subunit dehydrogenase